MIDIKNVDVLKWDEIVANATQEELRQMETDLNMMLNDVLFAQLGN